MVHLKKCQFRTYLLENMSSLNLNSYASIMWIIRSQSKLAANFSNNPRIYSYIFVSKKKKEKKGIMMFPKTLKFFSDVVRNWDLFSKCSYFQFRIIIQNKNPISVNGLLSKQWILIKRLWTIFCHKKCKVQVNICKN